MNGFTHFLRSPNTIVALALFLLVPLAVWIEKAEPALWQNRLVTASFVQEGNRHTPRIVEGSYLPPTIIRSRTLTAADSPVHITGTTNIPDTVTLTVEPGVELFFSEYANLIVNGTLIVNGSSDKRVIFQTNEEHIANRVWSGITFAAGSKGQLSYATMRHGSPAVTCEAQSTVTARYITISLGNLGVFTETPACTFSQSLIQHMHTGIIATNPTFTIPTSTTINATMRDIFYTNQK